YNIEHIDVDLIRPSDLIHYSQMKPYILQMNVDTADMAWAPSPSRKDLVAIGIIDKGTKALFQQPAARLFAAALSPADKLSFAQIDSLIDVNSWLTYLAVCDY